MNNTLYAFLLALIPGIVWLIYFLRKDNLPEPKRKILKVFLMGMLISVPILFFELWLIGDLNKLGLEGSNFLIIKYIFIIGLIEELFKYIAVRFSVLKSSEIDEPIDLPVYMIVGALGFATIENIILFCNQSSVLLSSPALLTFGRFLGATLLHLLCSGIIGYFLALSFYHLKYRYIFSFIGFFLAVIIHATFNFFLESSIINGVFSSFTLVLIIFVFFLFGLRKIKKLKSICKL
ncbi:MAG: PrsW family intramembrane metalloprotease [Candidatus Paceibacterota bacterium]|jgi:RsiW-degrading membrane proteinase PrsW (M82 family)